MRLKRTTGDPIKRMQAAQMAADRAGMMQGLTRVGEDDVAETPFPSGAVTMRPDILLDALLLGKEAPSLAMKLVKGKGAMAALNQLDDTSSAFLKKFDDYDEALKTYERAEDFPVFPFDDSAEILGFTRLARSGVTPDVLRSAGKNQAASAMKNLIDDGLIDVSESGMSRAVAAARAEASFPKFSP
tara:strand:- start:397 stop:954 length:558 start_codon:yes stop_codon:yes gene_type:complete